MATTWNTKFVDLKGKETLTGSNTGKYCPRNGQSDFRISGLRHRISHGHTIIMDLEHQLLTIPVLSVEVFL